MKAEALSAWREAEKDPVPLRLLLDKFSMSVYNEYIRRVWEGFPRQLPDLLKIDGNLLVGLKADAGSAERKLVLTFAVWMLLTIRTEIPQDAYSYVGALAGVFRENRKLFLTGEDLPGLSKQFGGSGDPALSYMSKELFDGKPFCFDVRGSETPVPTFLWNIIEQQKAQKPSNRPTPIPRLDVIVPLVKLANELPNQEHLAQMLILSWADDGYGKKWDKVSRLQ
jgi:hypothetical protein